MSPTNTLFSVLSFLTCICVGIPFPWHLEAWNTGTCLLMAWIGLSSMNNFVNSVIWRADAINRAPVWCDISSKFFMGAVVGIPASVLCISRRLYRIASIQVAITTRADKHRAVVFDLVMGVGVPIIYMALHYIVQGHRFNIFQEVGCFPFTYNTPLAYVLVMFPPLLLGVASGIYAILALIALNQRHHEFKSMVSQSSSQLTSGRYFRLMAIAGLDILCTVPLNVYTIYANLRGNVAPWISWEDTHSGFSRVDQFPSVIWRSDPALELSVEFNRWMLVAMGIIFFLFFGTTGEAVKHYKAAFHAMLAFFRCPARLNDPERGPVGVSSSFGCRSNLRSDGPPNAGRAIPVYIQQETIHQLDFGGAHTRVNVLDLKAPPYSLDIPSEHGQSHTLQWISDDSSSSGGSTFEDALDDKPLPKTPITATTTSMYSQSSATHGAGVRWPIPIFALHSSPPTPSRGERHDSFPVSITPDASFLDLSSSVPSTPSTAHFRNGNFLFVSEHKDYAS